METIVEIGHRILAGILIVGYIVLAVRFFKDREQKPTLFEKGLAQIVRFALLLEFVTGIIKSLQLHIWVSRWHHWACLLPVIAIVAFHILRMTRTVSMRTYAWLFVILSTSIVIISLTTLLNPWPTL